MISVKKEVVEGKDIILFKKCFNMGKQGKETVTLMLSLGEGRQNFRYSMSQDFTLNEVLRLSATEPK